MTCENILLPAFLRQNLLDDAAPIAVNAYCDIEDLVCVRERELHLWNLVRSSTFISNRALKNSAEKKNQTTF